MSRQLWSRSILEEVLEVEVLEEVLEVEVLEEVIFLAAPCNISLSSYTYY